MRPVYRIIWIMTSSVSYEVFDERIPRRGLTESSSMGQYECRRGLPTVSVEQFAEVALRLVFGLHARQE